jgi:ATP-binding cassette, subfamily C, bacterial LapB
MKFRFNLGGGPSGAGGPADFVLRPVRDAVDRIVDLLRDLVRNRYFQSLREVDWSVYQIGPILIASTLINLLELASPLYINIVYTSVLPAGSFSSLIVLTVAVVVLMVLGGWLKTVRLALTGVDGVRFEHRRRMEALIHFSQIRLGEYLKVSPATHADRLNSINLLRDESSLQALTTAIDLAFSLLFVVVLFLIAGSTGIVAVVAIVAYLLKALDFSRNFELLSRRSDRLELDRFSFHNRLIGSIALIKSNGLGRQFLVGNEERQEELAWQRMVNNNASGQYQAFGSLMSQLTYAGIVNWGALLVIEGRLMVGALAAALLLAGKILNPWQQAMGLWTSYRRLSHARDEYDALMSTPTESEGGQALLELPVDGVITVARGGVPLLTASVGSISLLRDQTFGADVRQLFMALIQIEHDSSLQLNGLAIQSYHRDALRQAIAYVNPSRQFFDGTLLENITSFQPRRYQKRVFFWSYLAGLDGAVRSLPQGYGTQMGTSTPSGLSRDSQQLFQVVTALARSPRILMLDLSDCSYGKEFIDGLQTILERCRGRISVFVSGTGRVLTTLSDQQIAIPTQWLVTRS